MQKFLKLSLLVKKRFFHFVSVLRMVTQELLKRLVKNLTLLVSVFVRLKQKLLESFVIQAEVKSFATS